MTLYARTPVVLEESLKTQLQNNVGVSHHLEALAVNDRWASIIILCLGDPHRLEGPQRRQDGPTNPHRVFALGWGNDLHSHCRWRKSCELLAETIGNTLEHCRATRAHDILVQVLTNVYVTGHDGVEHVWWIPSASLPIMLGWKSASGHLKRATSTSMTLPSGSSYAFCRSAEPLAFLSSSS